MIYKNKRVLVFSLQLLILLFLYFIHLSKTIDYKIFGIIGVVWSSILNVFVLFEYFKIDDDKIVHVYRLGFKKDEVYWKEINRVLIISDNYFKSVKIECGMFNGKEMVINSGINGYKDLLTKTLNKTRNNSSIVIDKRLISFINNSSMGNETSEGQEILLEETLERTNRSC